MGLAEILRRLFFDRSAAEQNFLEVREILREALAGSASDDDFDEALRRVLRRRHPEEDLHRFVSVKRLIWRRGRRRADAHGVSDRVLAQHALEDLPRIYGLPDRGREG